MSTEVVPPTRRYAKHWYNRCFRVFLDGVDVSNNCHWVDPVRGEVGLFHLNEEGKKYIVQICDCGECFPWKRGLRTEGAACPDCGSVFRYEVAIEVRPGFIQLRLRSLQWCAGQAWRALYGWWQGCRLDASGRTEEAPK